MSQIDYKYKIPVWEINGLEFEFDAEDPQTWVRYENAYKVMVEKSKHVPKDGGRSKAMKYEMDSIKELFNDIFGKGTASRIFKGQPNSRRYHYMVHNDFVQFVEKCRDECDEYMIENFGESDNESSIGKLA